MFILDAVQVKICREGSDIANHCCMSCKVLWAQRERLLIDMQPKQQQVASLLSRANLRFRSPPLHGPGGVSMPLAVLGTSHMRGARGVLSINSRRLLVYMFYFLFAHAFFSGR